MKVRMHRLLASTGAFIGRSNGRDFRLIGRILPELCCDGLELMFYEDWYGREDELCDYLESINAPVVTFHADKLIGGLLAQEKFSEALERFEINCSIAERLGAKTAVLHLWNGPTSDSNISANFSAYPKIEDIAKSHGVTVTAENVIAAGGSPLRLWHELLKTSPDAKFTYDTKMAQFDLDNEKAFLPENIGLWEHVKHLHLNDRTGGYRDWSSYRSLNLGDGEVDFDTFFDGLKKVRYKGDFTVEASAFLPDGGLGIGRLNESLKRARELIGRLE